MAVYLFSGRVLSALLAVSLIVSIGAAAPARAGHFLTHPASKPAGPSAATVATQAKAQAAAQAGTRGAKFKIKKDADVYITARNIPENDRLLGAYTADRIRTKAGAAAAVPGLLGIANQTYRAQDPNGRNAQTYSLADAMRDVIWRRNTAARLESLTASQSACADGTAGRAPSIGLIASC